MRSDAASVLKKHRLQVTAQRLAVLRVVALRPHGTADEIAKAVRAEIGTISRQAVYDTLRLLESRGLIRRIQPAGSAALYEDRVGDNHHHVICRKCGRTADVDCAVGQAPCLNAGSHAGFEIDEAEVIYWGTCPACQTVKPRTRAGGKTPAGEKSRPRKEPVEKKPHRTIARGNHGKSR